MPDEQAAGRPVLWGQLGNASAFQPTSGGKPKVGLPSRKRQQERLGGRFEKLDEAFAEQVTLTQSLGASDPQLVVVFEAIDERVDLEKVAELLGLEVLSDSEREYDPDPDFPRRSVNKDLPVTGCLHAVCLTDESKRNLLGRWAEWKRSGRLARGYAPLKDLFAHLKDVRPWGPQDRIRLAGLAGRIDGLVADSYEVEIELWFRRSPRLRASALDEVGRLVAAGGGTVLSTAEIGAVGYLGMKCEVPIALLRTLVSGDTESVSLVKSSHIMYLRASAQSVAFSEQISSGPQGDVPLPNGPPVLCLLDGYPVANHPLLAGRIQVTDGDDLASDTSSEPLLRRHGTAMASVCVWGDLSDGGKALDRPVLVRPILTASQSLPGQVEELPSSELAPDLMRRVFRELFEGSGPSAAVGESVVVVNLSVGDPAAPFDGIMSSWARTLDWLSSQYGVLVLVSAGNHGPVHVPGGDAVGVAAREGLERARAINELVASSTPRRSLLAPADSINALTVGALHSDGAGDVALGYRFDPADGELIVSPVSALGSGHRRSLKPDVVAPGGRIFFQEPMTSDEVLTPRLQGRVGPGIRVAASDGVSELFTNGTSPAAALVARSAARTVDVVLDIADRELSRSELAVATKALVVHSARIPNDLEVHEEISPFSHGYGALIRHAADGCDPNEATIIFVGDLGANEQRVLSLPIPAGLQQTGIKRVTATLAWHSPVNWRHRQYRCAALDFSKPTGFTELGSALDIDSLRSKKGTVQHAVWEVNRAIGVGPGRTIDLAVTCKEQAGGLHGDRVDFAVAMSLWIAPELGVDVYNDVKLQVGTRVRVGSVRE